MTDTTNLLRRLAGTRAALDALEADGARVARTAERIAGVLRAGGTLYTCGNGGSAAEALHFAEELVGCYRNRTRPPYRAQCLNADPTALTCIANDFGFEQIFARQVTAHVTPADALVVLTTSGNSPNLVRALEAARGAGALTVGFLGRDGGACLPLCDEAVVIPGPDSAHIQEAHLFLLHFVCEQMEPDAA